MSQTGDIVWSIASIHVPLTWWPPLTPSLCDLIAGLENWDIPDYTWDKRPTLDNEEHPHSVKKKRSLHTKITTTGQHIADVPGCSSRPAQRKLIQLDFYPCPRNGRNRALAHKCGGWDSFYCKAWGCETTGEAYWNPSSSWDLIKITRGNKGMDKINITFTEKGKQYLEWEKGRTWGLRFYMAGTDNGFTFCILLLIETITQAIGPNPVLLDQKDPQKRPSQRPRPTFPAKTPSVPETRTKSLLAS